MPCSISASCLTSSSLALSLSLSVRLSLSLSLAYSLSLHLLIPSDCSILTDLQYLQFSLSASLCESVCETDTDRQRDKACRRSGQSCRLHMVLGQWDSRQSSPAIVRLGGPRPSM